METIITIFLNSVISGLILSLVAIGFNFIFNVTKVFHLAHGAFFVLPVFMIAWLLFLFRTLFPELISIIISVFISLIAVTITIVLIEYLVYRPLFLKKVNSTISLISSLGVYFIIINLITFFWGNESIALNNNYGIAISNNHFNLTYIELIQLIVSTFLIGCVIFFSKTKFYNHIRAVTDNHSVAEKFGINVQRTRIMAFIIGTLLVGIAGIMKGYDVSIDPNAGLTIVLTASVAVIIGGVNSLSGTIIACFVIAVIENYSVMFISAKWVNLLTYVLLIIVLLFYKQGLISVKQRIETI